jgi:hypothetical protein
MMKGQLGFDEFLNISEEEQTNKEVETRPTRVPMVDPCYYCLCNSCVNNVENIRVKPNDTYCDWKPCFQCDNCRIYDGDSSKKNMEVASCDRYVIDNYHAVQNRKQFRLLGGKNG